MCHQCLHSCTDSQRSRHGQSARSGRSALQLLWHETPLPACELAPWCPTCEHLYRCPPKAERLQGATGSMNCMRKLPGSKHVRYVRPRAVDAGIDLDNCTGCDDWLLQMLLATERRRFNTKTASSVAATHVQAGRPACVLLVAVRVACSCGISQDFRICMRRGRHARLQPAKPCRCATQASSKLRKRASHLFFPSSASVRAHSCRRVRVTDQWCRSHGSLRVGAAHPDPRSSDSGCRLCYLAMDQGIQDPGGRPVER